MSESALRVFSIQKLDDLLGIRSEVRNIGSISDVSDDVDYEIKRQIHLEERGGRVRNETRSWGSIAKKIVYMPNLPPRTQCGKRPIIKINQCRSSQEIAPRTARANEKFINIRESV